LASLVLLLASIPLRAEVRPHGLFRDNAVLQRGVKLPVWGFTDRTEKVTVSLQGQEVITEPTDGKWRVDLAPLSAGGPYTLSIAQGSEKVELKNILSGDVWLCGGQSNMQWPLSQT